MIYPDVTLEEWIEKTGLPPDLDEYKCRGCGELFLVCVPVMTKDYFALESPVHKCGKGFTAAVLTPRSEAKIKIWDNIFENLFD